jgi:hypothetical protein
MLLPLGSWMLGLGTKIVTVLKTLVLLRQVPLSACDVLNWKIGLEGGSDERTGDSGSSVAVLIRILLYPRTVSSCCDVDIYKE